MLVMSRTENKDGKIQGFSLIEVRNGLKSAVLRVAPHVERPGRPLEYGLMMSRIAAWFLAQDHDAQIRIVQQGDAIIEELRQSDEPGPPLDGERAKEVGARHCGAKASARSPGAGSIRPGRHSVPDVNHPPVVWKVEVGGAKGAEAAGGVADRLEGDERAVGKRGRAPKGE